MLMHYRKYLTVSYKPLIRAILRPSYNLSVWLLSHVIIARFATRHTRRGIGGAITEETSLNIMRAICEHSNHLFFFNHNGVVAVVEYHVVLEAVVQ